MSIEKLNAIGKFLDRSKKQSDNINRFILDMLSDIAGLNTAGETDETMDRVSLHAIAVRNAFFDRTVDMGTVIPPELLVRKEYAETTINPRQAKPFGSKGGNTKT